MTFRHFELRDYVDDPPYARTYETLPQAERAAWAKARKQGAEILVYEVTDRGEYFVGSVG